jgi:regulator of sigma D
VNQKRNYKKSLGGTKFCDKKEVSKSFSNFSTVKQKKERKTEKNEKNKKRFCCKK